jgi:PIN domain nuclease of toxin-antitoxin system
MIAFVADTHALIWYLFNDLRLSTPARKAFTDAADAGLEIGVSSISLAEIVYLIEKGRIPSNTLDEVLRVLNDAERELKEVALTADIASQMRGISREEVPDLPDRVIAATARLLAVPVITRDGRIRSSALETV